MRLTLSFALVALLFAGTAAAQQTTIPNPLRPPAPARQQATAAPEATEEKARPRRARKAKAADSETGEAAPKPKRQRSAKQLQNDEDMRSCGVDWRDRKGELQSQGQTWRTFLSGCRNRLKTARGV
ncbi:MAG: hypothetical protein ACRC7G_06285 [Beijerinckiaceae bacterium]